MNYLFIPIVFYPIFGFEYPEPMAYIQYAPVRVYGRKAQQECIYITEDYNPYTHGFLPEDGSELWDDEQDS